MLQEQMPTAYQTISQNPEVFMRLITHGMAGEGEEGEESEEAHGEEELVYLSQEEHEAIQRLQQLGFSKERAAEAYLTCDKNEEMAANLLFDQAAFESFEANPNNNGGGNNNGNNNNNGGAG